MRLKWLRLGVAAALIGTSAHAEWQFAYTGGDEGAGYYTAYSWDAADWYEVIRDAKAISFRDVGAGSNWQILYLNPDGSVWYCQFSGRKDPNFMIMLDNNDIIFNGSYCLVND